MNKNRLFSLITLLVLLVSQYNYAQTCTAPNNIYQNTSNAVTGVSDQGQSFTATCNGNIISLRVWTNGVAQNINGTLKIYEGTFTNFYQGADLNLPILHEQNFNWGTSSSEVEQTIELSSIVPVTSGQTYTFMLLNTNGRTTYSYHDALPNNIYTDGDQKERSGNFWYNDSDDDLKFQIHYTDVIAPTARCKNATIYLDANGNANLHYTQINNGSSGGTSFQLSQESFNCNDLGPNTVTLNVLDNAFNGDSCQATVTVVDNSPPVNVTCPQNIVVNNCGNVVTYDMPTFSDNTEPECGLTIELISGFESGEIFPINQTTTVTYRATDGSGLFTDCSFTVTSQDLVYPTVSGIPEDQTIYLTDGCEALIDAYTPMATDNCPGLTTNPMTGISGTGPFPLGTTVNTFSYTDIAGNTTIESFTVTVIDNQSPTAACQDVNLVLDENGSGTVTINQINNGSTDNCTITSMSLSIMDFVGATTTSSTTDDLLSNNTTYYVESYSFTAPVTGQYEFTYSGTSTDNFGIIMSLWKDVPVRNSGSFAGRDEFKGYTSRNFDGSLSGGDQFHDLTAGTTYYFDMTSNVASNTITYDGKVIINETDLNFSCNPGTYPIELLVVDNSGNTSNCTSTITVTKPALVFDTCPSDETFSTDADNCTTTITFNTPTVTNTSCGAIVTQTSGLPSGSDFPVGDNYIEFTATNDLGETTVCSFTFTVEDNENPVITSVCPSDIVMDNSATGTGTTVTYDAITFTDNCTELSNLSITQIAGLSSGSVFPIGTTYNKIEATDESGNTTTCSFYVTVNDTFTPQIACQDYAVDITSSSNIVTPNDLNNGSTDNSNALNFGFLTSSISGETSLSGPTDIYEGGGLDISYVQVYAFQVPSNGFYELSVSGTTSYPSNDNFYLSLYDQRPVLMTGDGNQNNPGYISNSFTLFNGDGSPNDGPAEFNLVTDKTYFVEISSANSGYIAEFQFNISQNIISTEASLSFDCSDVGTVNQTLYAYDDFGNIVSCTSSISVINTEAANAICDNPYISQADIDANNGKIYPQDIDNGSIGYTGFLENVFEEIITTNSPTISNTVGGIYYFKKMIFTPLVTETRQITLASNKATIFAIFDKDDNNEPLEFNESLAITFAPENGQNSTTISLEANKVYYGYFLILNNTDLTTDAQFSLTWENSPIISTLASRVPAPNSCQMLLELYAFDDCGNMDTCLSQITLDACFDDAFETTWQTTSANESITIYTNTTDYPTGYDYTIIWGDGTSDFNVTGDITHEYLVADDYVVKIIGTFPQILQGNENFSQGVHSSNAAKLQSINQWGDTQWKSMEASFKGCANVQLLATDIPDLSLVTSTNFMFFGCDAFTGNDSMNSWNMSTIETMREMFESTSNFNAIIGGWNVSNVTDMFGMFLVATSFNQDLNNWNVGEVTTMKSMFHLATAFNGNISGWNVEKLENMENMFWGAADFDQNIGSWNVSMVTDMSGVFYNATDFDQDISNWNLANVLETDTMFRNATSFNQDIGDWDVSKVTNMYEMFAGATAFDQDIGDWDISALTNASFMFTDVELSASNYDALLMGWSTLETGETQIPTTIVFSAGNSRYCAGEAAWNLLTNALPAPTGYGWTITDGGTSSNFCNPIPFTTTWQTTEIDETITIYTNALEPSYSYNYDISWGDGTTDTNVTGNISHVYAVADDYEVAIIGVFPQLSQGNGNDNANAAKLQSIDLWGTIEWLSMEDAFFGCENVVINATDAPNLTNTESLNSMFRDALLTNTDINHWDVSNITDMRSVFRGTQYDGPLNSWDVSNVNEMGNMFYGTPFNQYIGNWDMTNITNIAGMFEDAIAFDQDIGSWNTSNVEDMSDLFSGAIAFNRDISDWDVSSVDDMSQMFDGAIVFTQDISTWDVSSVDDMKKMFKGAIAFNQDISGWDVSLVDNMQEMFNGAIAFNQNLGNWDIGSLAEAVDYGGGLEGSMVNMFSGVTLSVENYDNTLIGWATDSSPGGSGDGIDDIPSGISFSGGNSSYCMAINERNTLENTYNWTITDKGYCEDFFITTWQTTTANESITIPTSGGGYNYSVDWGDNTYDTNITGDATHIYAVAGTYTVSITSGTFPRIYFENSSDKAKILTVEQWGNNQWSSMFRAFRNCSNLDVVATDVPNLSSVSHMGSMFFGCSNLIGTEVFNDWDMSNISNLGAMFQSAVNFNQPLSNWDVSNVIKFTSMFENATSFNQSLASWDISSLLNTNVTNATSMFSGATVSTENYDATLIGWATLEVGEIRIPQNITFSGGNSKYCLSETQRQNLIDTHGWIITDNGKQCDVLLSPKVYLQGASLNPNLGEETLMRDDLRVGGLLESSPYIDGLTANNFVFSTTGPDAIVDWVWVELRDATNNTIIIDSQSALLQRDGDVVDIDGVSPLSFNQAVGNYYVVIKHRNHLGIMSASSIALDNATTIVDFTNGSVSTYNTNAQGVFGMPSGVLGMWAGNANGDTVVQYSGTNPDTPSILSAILNDAGNFLNFPTYAIDDYNNNDVDMNGSTQYTGTTPDTPFILQNVLSHPGNFLKFSTYQIKEQLPENE